MEDAQIIEMYFRRDENAIRETQRKYGGLCQRIAEHILSDREDAEECVNDLYFQLWNSMPPVHPLNLSAYICRITRNQALKKLEFRSAGKRTPEAILPLSELEEILPDERCVDMEPEELGRLLSEFLRGEKTAVRNVFIRRYWFCDSVSEIAARYSFNESRVRSMLFRAKNRLRAYLKKEGFEI